MKSALGCVNGQHQIIWTKAIPLRVRVSKHSALKHLVIRVVYSRHNETGTKRELLILSEEIIDVSIEHQSANGLEWEDVLRPGLGVI